MYPEIKKHKVFISFKYYDDYPYKDWLIKLNEKYDIFEDWSVGEGEIDDNLPHEQIRRKIRDEFISDSTVLILLNGPNMRKSKFIDWELHAAMTNYDNNPQMGILVINLPENKEGNFNSTGLVKEIVEKNGDFRHWGVLNQNYDELLKEKPNSPARLLANIIRPKVRIDMITWNDLTKLSEWNAAENIKLLVDEAFKNRHSNEYDYSDPLRKRAYQ